MEKTDLLAVKTKLLNSLNDALEPYTADSKFGKPDLLDTVARRIGEKGTQLLVLVTTETETVKAVRMPMLDFRHAPAFGWRSPQKLTVNRELIYGFLGELKDFHHEHGIFIEEDDIERYCNGMHETQHFEDYDDEV